MLHHPRHILFTLATLGLAAALVAQPASKRDPKIKEQLKEFSKLIKDREAAKDGDAIKIIDELSQKVDTMHKSDKRDYAKGLAEAVTSRRVKREPAQATLFEASIRLLGQTGDAGSAYLKKAFDAKKFTAAKDRKLWLALRAQMLEHLGRTKDSKMIDFLTDTALREPEATLQAAAGKALRHYVEEKLAVRKDVCKELIKKLNEIWSKANANLDPGDLNVATAKKRMQTILDPWNETLQKLSKQHYRTPADWQRFYNKHKGDNWDKPLRKTR